jgi:hypothetical protein
MVCVGSVYDLCRIGVWSWVAVPDAVQKVSGGRERGGEGWATGFMFPLVITG